VENSFIINIQIADDELKSQLQAWALECTALQEVSANHKAIKECQFFLWDYDTYTRHTQLNIGLPNGLIVFSNTWTQIAERDVLLSGALDFMVPTLNMGNILLRLSQHVQRLRYVARLENLSVTDTLTGLFNRRKYDIELDKCWRQSQRFNTPCSLLLLDVDHFKNYNDSYGHLAGDKCLIQLAEVFQAEAVRPLDTAARIGGEEFAVILPQTPQEGALHVAQRILNRIRELKIPHTGTALGYLTLSIGSVSICPSLADNIVDWHQSADDVLYLAKDRGRNQVVEAELKSQSHQPAPRTLVSNEETPSEVV
jgi:diguanylate cyclase (GGDEF)-like protein